MTVSYGGNQLTYPYIIHAAIDEASFKMDEMYKLDSSDRLVFYNTQQEFDASGSMRFAYKQLSVGGKTGAAGLTSSVPLSSADIAVTGYQSSVGEYNVADGQGLTVTYDYYGTTYTKAFDFVVKSPSIASLRQTSAAVLPLGVTASDYYSQITFDAVYDDGSTQSYDLDDATVVSVGGSAATTLDTSVAGVYTAVIEFRPATSSVPTAGDDSLCGGTCAHLRTVYLRVHSVRRRREGRHSRYGDHHRRKRQPFALRSAFRGDGR